jgi:hypothetical protein
VECAVSLSRTDTPTLIVHDADHELAHLLRLAVLTFVVMEHSCIAT